MRVVQGNNDTIECSNFFFNATDNILQVTIDDPDPDDNFYIDFIKNNSEVVIAESETDRSNPFEIDNDASRYSVKYNSKGNSQVNLDFSIKS